MQVRASRRIRCTILTSVCFSGEFFAIDRMSPPYGEQLCFTVVCCLQAYINATPQARAEVFQAVESLIVCDCPRRPSRCTCAVNTRLRLVAQHNQPQLVRYCWACVQFVCGVEGMLYAIQCVTDCVCFRQQRLRRTNGT